MDSKTKGCLGKERRGERNIQKRERGCYRAEATKVNDAHDAHKRKGSCQQALPWTTYPSWQAIRPAMAAAAAMGVIAEAASPTGPHVISCDAADVLVMPILTGGDSPRAHGMRSVWASWEILLPFCATDNFELLAYLARKLRVVTRLDHRCVTDKATLGCR